MRVPPPVVDGRVLRRRSAASCHDHLARHWQGRVDVSAVREAAPVLASRA